jgi:hypothetical protein
MARIAHATWCPHAGNRRPATIPSDLIEPISDQELGV